MAERIDKGPEPATPPPWETGAYGDTVKPFDGLVREVYQADDDEPVPLAIVGEVLDAAAMAHRVNNWEALYGQSEQLRERLNDLEGAIARLCQLNGVDAGDADVATLERLVEALGGATQKAAARAMTREGEQDIQLYGLCCELMSWERIDPKRVQVDQATGLVSVGGLDASQRYRVYLSPDKNWPQSEGA